MGDIKTSVKINGDAAGLKTELASLKVQVAQAQATLSKATKATSVDASEMLHAFHAGSLTATGSIRGMGMALKEMGPMMPLIAAGLLFEALNKIGAFKKITEDITDAIGLTSHAFDEETETINRQNTAILLTIKYEHDLAAARGASHDELLGYTIQEENVKIAAANNDIQRVKNEDVRKKSIFLEGIAYIMNGGNVAYTAAAGFNVMEFESKKKLSEKSQKLVEDDQAKILASQRVISEATTKTTFDDDKELYKEGQKASDDQLNILKEETNKANKIRKKNFEDSQYGYKLLAAQGKSAEEKITQAEKDHADKVRKYQDDQRNAWQSERGTIMEVANAFDTLFEGGADGWKNMEKQMIGYFKKMIAEVIAATIVWTILDIVSGGASGEAMSLGKTITNTLGFTKHASGTNFAPGGLALVGERGPELVNLPRGSQVIPNGGFNQRISVYGMQRGADTFWSNYRYGNILNNNT